MVLQNGISKQFLRVSVLPADKVKDGVSTQGWLTAYRSDWACMLALLQMRHRRAQPVPGEASQFSGLVDGIDPAV